MALGFTLSNLLGMDFSHSLVYQYSSKWEPMILLASPHCLALIGHLGSLHGKMKIVIFWISSPSFYLNVFFYMVFLIGLELCFSNSFPLCHFLTSVWRNPTVSAAFPPCPALSHFSFSSSKWLMGLFSSGLLITCWCLHNKLIINILWAELTIHVWGFLYIYI